ncbi:hypothetical protein POM88_040833 [Heracleum sosnowskyi]|uniref:Uncharacterized protein n=1 Tax=Heracleum sosnowskyi TaxID=360622 RepID=A0AAD8HD07_9APIA|nr:hypothetical protein POM88_040833 [Heracleum sosnowskyi]
MQVFLFWLFQMVAEQILKLEPNIEVYCKPKCKPKCADDDDELVEVLGEVGSVRDALIQIVLRLRDDVLKDREVNQNPSDGVGLHSLYPVSADFSVPPVLPSIPPVGHFSLSRG